MSRFEPSGIALLALAIASGCAPDAPGTSESAGGSLADAQQLMLSVIEPAAETYWDAVGWVLDSAGVHPIVPATAEEWQAVVDAAWVVAESGHLLLMPGRTANGVEADPAWRAMAGGLTSAGRAAVTAAEARDPQAVFDAGAELYQACVACHAAYATETLRPSHAADGDSTSTGIPRS